MNEPPIEASEPDPAAVGAALLLADLHEAVAEATSRLATLAVAVAVVAPGPVPPVLTPTMAKVETPAAMEAADVSPKRLPGSTNVDYLPPEPPAAVGKRDSAAGWPGSTLALTEPASLPLTEGRVGLSAPTVLPVITRPMDVATSAPIWSTPIELVTPPADAALPAPAAAALNLALADGPTVSRPVTPAGATPASGTTPVAALPVAPLLNAGNAVSPQIPVGLTPAPGSTSEPPAMFAPTAPQSAVPPPREQPGPTGGDVFLDGNRIGRWLADTLAREAGGPAVGATGFDPRLGPTWPGALQGNGT